MGDQLYFSNVINSGPEPRVRLSSAAQLRRMKRERDAIKANGGEQYRLLLKHEREARAKYRTGHPDYWKNGKRENRPFKTELCHRARMRGRKRGLVSTIRPEDLIWPSHCPVLGIELDYPERTRTRGEQRAQPNWPSLDRWDSSKGYVPGNVFVISLRANTLKNNVTREEILKIAQYVMRKPHYERG